MKTIKLVSMAKFLDISPAFLCQVKYGKRRFSSKKAKQISERTGIPLEKLLFSEGDKIYKALSFCFATQDEEGQQ